MAADPAYKLLLVCQQIAIEAQPIYLGCSTCDLAQVDWSVRPVGHLQTKPCKNVRSIKVDLSFTANLYQAITEDEFPMLQTIEAMWSFAVDRRQRVLLSRDPSHIGAKVRQVVEESKQNVGAVNLLPGKYLALAEAKPSIKTYVRLSFEWQTEEVRLVRNYTYSSR